MLLGRETSYKMSRQSAFRQYSPDTWVADFLWTNWRPLRDSVNDCQQAARRSVSTFKAHLWQQKPITGNLKHPSQLCTLHLVLGPRSCQVHFILSCLYFLLGIYILATFKSTDSSKNKTKKKSNSQNVVKITWGDRVQLSSDKISPVPRVRVNVNPI